MHPTRAQARRVRRRGLLIGAAIVISGPLLTVPAGALVSRLYWGHWFSRPEPSRLLIGANTVTSLGELSFVTSADGGVKATNPHAVPDAKERVTAGLAHAEYPHYYLQERVLEVLAPMIMPGATPPTPATGLLDAVARQLRERRLLVKPGAGYESRGRVAEGLVAEFLDSAGRRFIVASLSQGEVSNDHHPYHEIIFAVKPDGSIGRVASHTRFYFDLAGLEGMTWRSAASCAFTPLTILGVVVGCAAMGRALAVAHRLTEGLCVKCRYDLTGCTLGVCPECGTQTSGAPFPSGGVA